MTMRWIPFLLALALAGCNWVDASVPTMPSAESQAEAAMKNRLEQLLETCLAAAKKASTPAEAEAMALTVYARWKQTERAESQFHVQAQRRADGGLQVQLQAQLVEGSRSVQAQRQAALAPLPAR